MKVQHDTGWHSLINKALIEKHVDKLEERNQDLSQYSSISSLTNVWTAKHLWQSKDCQNLPKRHRFPPSLLSSRAADLWNTLLPLRANCSCSSVSVNDKCSRLSFKVSTSDATFGSKSDYSVSPVEETAVRTSFGDTLEHTHLAFEFLMGRMVRLLSGLNQKSSTPGSSIFFCSDSNLQTLSLPSLESEKNTKLITEDSYSKHPSVASLLSNSSDHYRGNWSTGRAARGCESSSKFEVAEQKRQFIENVLFIIYEFILKRSLGRVVFSPGLLVPKTLRIPKSVLTKEELVHLLQHKKSLLSEYFQREVDSRDLKRNLDLSQGKTVICGTQSDSGLQEHNLLQFVYFIRSRAKKNSEDSLKTDDNSLENQKLNTIFHTLINEDCPNFSTPKRRVTFSDPLAETSSSLLNCCSFNNEDGISSVKSFTTASTNNFEILRDQNTQLGALLDSKSVSHSDSSVSLKACFANLGLKSLCTKVHDPIVDLNKPSMEQTVISGKNIRNEKLGSVQLEYDDEIKFQKNTPYDDTSVAITAGKEFREKANDGSLMAVEQSQPDENGNFFHQFSSSDPSNSLRELGKFGIRENEEIIEGEIPAELNFLVMEILDSGTTHIPMLNNVVPVEIFEVDNSSPQIRYKKCNPQENFKKCLKRGECSMGIRKNWNSIDNDHYASNGDLDDQSIRNQINRRINIQRSKIPVLCNQRKLTRTFSKEEGFYDADVINRPSLPSGKTVTFQDCCETCYKSDQSIVSDQMEPQRLLQSDNKSVSSSESKGRFELSWKGCWDQESKTDSAHSREQFEINNTEYDPQFIESNQSTVTSKNSVLTTINACKVEPNLFSNNHGPSPTVSGSQTSTYTTVNNEAQLKKNHRSKCRSRDVEVTSPSSHPHSSNSSSFVTTKTILDKNEIIPWMLDSDEDLSKSSKPTIKSNYSYESNPEVMKLQNRTELRRGLGNIYKGIMNPEIWSSEVRSEPTALSKSNWYTHESLSDRYSWKSQESRCNWLVQKLEELKSSPGTDYESDYNEVSEIDSNYESERDMSLMKRSLSKLDIHSEDYTKFTKGRNRFEPNLFLNKVLSRNKFLFNECRCQKNTTGNRYDLGRREHDLKHRFFQESDQQSNQNFFSHFRARLILDSETDDSDFAPSIQPDFRYDLKHRDGHVNKIKCRRFVKSLKSIRLDEDRFSHVILEKTPSPVSVQSALSTLSVATNISEKQNFCNTMDVCIDTCDLCRPKPIGVTNDASDLIFSIKHSSCQTLESSFCISNSVQCTKSMSQASSINFETDILSGSSLKIPRSNEQKISSALANLSTRINNTSNNLAKLRSSEFTTEPERDLPLPLTKEGNFITDPSIQYTSTILSSFSPPIKTFHSIQNSVTNSDNIPNNSDSYTIGVSSCPICNFHKKPTGRYLLPPCIVKGAGPDSIINENDPWNRVMERAKVQHRHKERNTSLKQSLLNSSAYETENTRSAERNQNFFASHQSLKKGVGIQLVQVKNNTSQATVCDLENHTVIDKILPPPQINGPHRLPHTSAALVCSSMYHDIPIVNLPRTRTPRTTGKLQGVTNTTNRLLYIISETAELTHQVPIKSPAANLFN